MTIAEAKLKVPSEEGSECVTAIDSRETSEDNHSHNLKRPIRVAVLIPGDNTIVEYGQYDAMFESLLREPGDTWQSFWVVNGEFPSHEQVHQLDAFIVTGSRHDAHSDAAWNMQLCDLIRRLAADRRKRLLGVCYGHQIVARALGGITGRAPVGWEAGIRQVRRSPALTAASLAHLPFADALPAEFNILEVHQDQVLSLPPSALLLASSPLTPVEVFSLRDASHVLCLQGHPEFCPALVRGIVEKQRAAGRMTDDVASAAIASMEGAAEDREKLRSLCQAFLRS